MGLKLGGLGDCDCGDTEVSYAEETVKFKPPIAVAPVKKPRKKRSKGSGSYCVVSHKGNEVHCYKDSATAERVAKAFSSRGRAGTKFHVSRKK